MSITASDVTAVLPADIVPTVMQSHYTADGSWQTTDPTVPVACQIVLENERGTAFTSLALFVEMFGAATDMSAAALHQVDGGNLGFGPVIDWWDSQGWLPKS